MNVHTLLVVVASVGVVATAAVIGTGVGVPQANDISSFGETTAGHPTTTTESPDRASAAASGAATGAPAESTDSGETPGDSPSAEARAGAESADSTANASTGTDADAAESGTAEGGTVANETATNAAPVAVARADAMVHERTRVELDGAGSRDPDGDELNYTWTQISGPDAELVRNDTSTGAFVSPDVAVWTDVRFRLTVTDDDGASDTANVTITVRSTEYDDVDADDLDRSESNATGGEDATGGDDAVAEPGRTESRTMTRDEISRALFGSSFESLGTDDAVFVEEVFLRQPSDDGWNPADVRSREEIARDRYDESFDGLGFEARVDVQEAYDAQFGDFGANAAYTRDEISQAEWGYDFTELSAESAARITEIHDRLPFADGQELAHVRTREQFAFRLYDASLADLTREQRLAVERRYHEQFADDD
jgi:hypothetical protein